MWLSELEHMAKQEGCPQELIQDLETIKEWGSYSKDTLAEYKGTSLEKEFAAYAAAIEKAQQSGDAMAVGAAEERWIQERFARGVPSMKFRHSFRHLMRFLCFDRLSNREMSKGNERAT